MGIKSEDIKNLFDDYAQMNTKSNRKIEGTGLGLPITKKMVEMMDGSITVESEYNKGSTFTVRLRQGFVGDSVIGEEVVASLKSFNYFDHRRIKNSQMIRTYIPYARVLVVDDVQTNLDVSRAMMNPYGMQIDCMTSGQEAIDAIRDEKVKYDAVFMDHMMPEMDGIEAVKIIREEIGTEYAKTVPIIALTANAIVGNEEMFLKNGFQAFISKPIDVTHLDSVLHTWIVSKQNEDTLLKAENESAKLFANRHNNLNILKDVFIDGMDFNKGIEMIINEETYLNVIRSYCLHTPDMLKKLRAFTGENNNPAAGGITLSEYGITVHGLKGSSYSICAETVGAEAEKLEIAAKGGDVEFFMAKNVSFIKKAESLLSELGVLLQNVSKQTEATKKEALAPDTVLFSKLLEAAREYRSTIMEQIIVELESYRYKSGGDLVVWLREQIDNLEYDAIIERLEADNTL
jgi:CheY-like chemotaxis protein